MTQLPLVSSWFYSLIKLKCETLFIFQVDNPNSVGNTPLHVACYNGQDVVIEELINNGANVNAANTKGLVRTVFCFWIESCYEIFLSGFNVFHHFISDATSLRCSS